MLAGMAIAGEARHAAGQLPGEPIAQGAQALSFLQETAQSNFTGFTEADNRGHILGPRTSTALVTRPMDKRLQAHAASDVERANPLGSVELVADHREQIHAQIIDS